MRAVGLAATGYIVLWAGIALATGRLHADYGNLINAYLAIFLAPLLVCAAAVRTPALNAPLNRYLNAFAELLSRRGAFTSDVRQEIPKFALIRILFGFCLAVRAFWIIYYLQPSDWHHPLIWSLAVAHLEASVLVMTGTLTTAAFVYLVIVQWTYGGWTLGTYTLGNYIAAMLSFLLIFANAGAHYSVDALLLRGTNEVSSLAKRGYYKGGITSENALQVAKFLTLLMYWCVCLYSLSMHVNESAWMSGNAGPLLLSNRFMSTYGAEFEHFFELGKWAVSLGRISLWSMLPWYLFVIPFVMLGGLFRKYVLVWSILFFALSEFVLQLGSLATFEFLMLARRLVHCTSFMTTGAISVTARSGSFALLTGSGGSNSSRFHRTWRTCRSSASPTMKRLPIFMASTPFRAPLRSRATNSTWPSRDASCSCGPSTRSCSPAVIWAAGRFIE